MSQLTDAARGDISVAYDTFTAAVEAIHSDLSPSETAPQYQAAIDGWTTGIEAVQAEVGCS